MSINKRVMIIQSARIHLEGVCIDWAEKNDLTEAETLNILAGIIVSFTRADIVAEREEAESAENVEETSP